MSPIKKKKTDEVENELEKSEFTSSPEGEKAVDEPVKETEEETSKEKKSKEPKAPRKRSKFVSFLIALLAGVVLVAIGAGAVYFGLYTPKTTALSAEVNTSTTELATAQAEIERLKGVESSLTADLTQANQEIADMTSDLEKAKSLSSIYQIQSNVNIARLALSKADPDPSGASQAVEYIINNIQNLTVPAFPGTSENLETRLTGIRTDITTDITKALADLDALYRDLLLLADNVK